MKISEFFTEVRNLLGDQGQNICRNAFGRDAIGNDLEVSELHNACTLCLDGAMLLTARRHKVPIDEMRNYFRMFIVPKGEYSIWRFNDTNTPSTVINTLDAVIEQTKGWESVEK